MGNGNIGVGNTEPRPANPASKWPARCRSKAPAIMGDNQCSPQKLVRLVGCRDPKAKPGSEVRPHPDPAKR